MDDQIPGAGQDPFNEVQEYLELINDFIRNTLNAQAKDDPSPLDVLADAENPEEEVKTGAPEEPHQSVSDF